MTNRTEHRGWHTPRKLPHFDSAETTHAITFRLADSLPRAVAEAKRHDSNAAYRRRIEAALDAGLGACWLGRPAIARVVETVLLARDGEQYDIHAHVVMPNHVHVLITQREGYRLADVVQAWKGVSAKAINAALARTGRVWQRDYFDRFMRDEVHFEKTRG